MIIGIVFGIALAESPESGHSAYVNIMEYLNSTSVYYISFIGTALINIYLVRKWSKEWNKQFDDNSKQINSQENVEN